MNSIEKKEEHFISTVCAMADDGCLLLQVRRVTCAIWIEMEVS